MSIVNLKQIFATDDFIKFTLSGATKTTTNLKIYSPSVEHTFIKELSIQVFGNSFSIPRVDKETNIDYLTYYFETDFNGPHYVSDIKAEYNYPYPIITTKKGLRTADIKSGVRMDSLEDVVAVGSHHDSIDLHISSLVSAFPASNTTEYIYAGKTYYINNDTLQTLDTHIKYETDHDVLLTITLLVYAQEIDDDRMVMIARHPDYDGMGKVSMFNIVTEEGVDYYSAVCNFLAERYTREDSLYGRITGFIIGNEASVQGAWCNAGDKTVQEFSDQYLTSMRIAWQIGSAYWSNWRVYASFDNHWNEAFVPQLYLKFYKGREMLEYMIDKTLADGDFGWHIAYHPYTSNLINPAFWNDPDATFDYLNSPVISFKNLVLLQHFVKIPKNMYKGKPRVIILAEQGFNGANRPMEYTQAMAYGKAYKVAMNMPEVESFIYHSQFDHAAEEHGLQLGVWRTETSGSVERDARPIYTLLKYIDQPAAEKPEKQLWELF